MPRTGDIVHRKEKAWRVTGVYAVPLSAPHSALPHSFTGYVEIRICELAGFLMYGGSATVYFDRSTLDPWRVR
jgi:hypothetical protein